MTDRSTSLAERELPSAAPLPRSEAEPLTFQAVYDAYFAFVWRAAANRSVPRAQMDDVVQEVFLVVHRKLAEFEGRSSVRTWLSGIVRRVVADHVRKRGNQSAGDETIEGHAFASGHDPSQTLEQNAAVAACDAILQKLSEPQREVFVLYELEQLTTREIAEITGVNENTVQSRLKAARKEFDRGVLRHRAQLAREEK